MLNRFFIISIFISGNLCAQFIDYTDKEIVSGYNQALNYSEDSLRAIINLKKQAAFYSINKADSIQHLKIPENHVTFIIRLSGYSFFDYKDSLSSVNSLCANVVAEHPDVKVLSITGRHLKHNNSRVKYNFSALNISYLKKRLGYFNKCIKLYALSEVEKDFPSSSLNENYIDLIFIY